MDSTPPPTVRSRGLPTVAVGCLVVASLPFVGAGMLIVREGWRRHTDLPAFNQVTLPLIGLAFVLFGLTIAAIGIYVYRSWVKTTAARARHPEQPWMWREDWAAGTIADTSLADSAFLLLFAVLWNLVSWGIAAALWPKLRDPDTKIVYVVLLFPAIGILLLVAAVRAAVRRRKYGTSICRPSQMPVRPGTLVRFAVQMRLGERPEHGLDVKLTCLQRVMHGSGKGASTSDTVLWQDEAQVDAGAMVPGPFGSEAAVTFRLPHDAPPTDARNPRNRILWRLTAAADVPGVAYSAGFEIPVFGEAPPLDEEEVREIAAERGHEPFDPSQLLGITISERPDGGEEIDFAASRSRGLAGSLLLFLLVFGGALLFIVTLQAPIVFDLLFGFIVLLLFVAAWDAWFATTRVVASREGLRITRGWLLFAREVSVEAADVVSIAPAVMASSSRGDAAEAIYRLEVTTKAGRKRSAGGYIPSMRAAEFLAARLRVAMGLR